MIKVVVELWPYGNEENKTTLAEAFIANDGTGSQTNGNYDCWIKQKTNRSLKFGRVTNHKRLSQSIWVLLVKCIQSALAGDQSITDSGTHLKSRAES